MLRFVLPIALTLSACGTPVAPAVEAPGQPSPMETQFDAAASEFQVPVQVLKGIAWASSRVSAQADLKSASGAVGVMQLSSSEGWNMQARGAALTGVDPGRLAIDSRANIRAAAAVLRELFDRAAANDQTLQAVQLGDWYPAVSLYPGFEGLDIAASFTNDVFETIERGFAVTNADGTVLLLPAASLWRRHAPEMSLRRDALGDYPGNAAFTESPNHSNGHGAYDFVLIHTMQGSYAGSRSWFLNTASRASSHYLVRSSDGEITQMVSDSDTAWHAQCYNGRSIGIEHEGFIADPGRWYTDAMYTESAKLTAWLCTRHNIPKDRSHIIGHNEVPTSCNTNGHTDPGSGWNWTKYMGLVGTGGGTTTTGTLIGAIYTGGNTSNRVAGAVVTLNGMSVTTAADGLYQFQIAPGSYTPTVTKSGFTTNTVTRTVTANTQTWGSMEINPSTAATGTLSGKVYAFNASTPSDMSQAIAGAVVTVNSQMMTTGADGLFTFPLPAGTYTLQVTKSGYVTSSSTRTVTSGATTTADTGLSVMSSADVVPPVIAFTFPQSMARLDIADVQIVGTASDDRGPLANVRLTINAGTELELTVTNGQFSIDAQLVPGLNQIVARGTDAAGNQTTATLICTFAAGVSGTVFNQEAPATKLAGATVELRAVGAATPLETKTTAADGRFAIDVVTQGDYLLTVKAEGYRSSSQTITIGNEQRLQVDVGLVAGEDNTGAGTVNIVEPMNGSTVMTDTVTVYGTVAGFDVTEVKVNGARAELIGAGGFSATIPLVAGLNDITAVAQGLAGQTALTTIAVTRTDMTTRQQVAGVIGSVGCSSTSSSTMLWALLAGAWLLRRSLRR